MYVCVWEGEGQFLQELCLLVSPRGDPQAVFHCPPCGTWLKPTASCICEFIEIRVLRDGITQCLPDLYLCRDLHSSQDNKHKSAHSKQKCSLLCLVGMWNVCSMVDTEGTVATASKRQDGQTGEERKVDLVVPELKRDNVKVAGL